MKWAVELSAHDINYQPWTVLKSQVIVDFIVDFTPNPLIEGGNDQMMLQGQNQTEPWKSAHICIQ